MATIADFSVKATVSVGISEEAAKRCIKILQMYLEDNDLVESIEIYKNRYEEKYYKPIEE